MNRQTLDLKGYDTIGVAKDKVIEKSLEWHNQIINI
jgi:hypothetical protein